MKRPTMPLPAYVPVQSRASIIVNRIIALAFWAVLAAVGTISAVTVLAHWLAR